MRNKLIALIPILALAGTCAAAPAVTAVAGNARPALTHTWAEGTARTHTWA